MGFFDGFPWANGHQLNLDWILEALRKFEDKLPEFQEEINAEFERLQKQYEDFAATNTVTYRGDWNSQLSYKKWDVVTNGLDVYLSVDQVPRGIPLDDTRYWQKAGSLTPEFAALEQQIEELQTVIGVFSTLEEMISFPNLVTDGVYKILARNAGDYGQAYYKIAESYQEDDYFVELPDGRYAVMLPIVVTVDAFGPPVDADASEVFNTATKWAAKHVSLLLIPPKQYRVNDVVLYTDLEIRGMSRQKSILYVTEGSCCLKSVNFEDLMEDVPDTKMPDQIAIKNLTILGDADYSKTIRGINLYCSNPTIDCVTIRNVSGDGVYSQSDPNKLLPPIYKIEGNFRNVDIMFVGGHGWHFDGPNDSHFQNITVVDASQKEDNVYASLFLNTANCRMDMVHCWNFADGAGYQRPRYALHVPTGAGLQITNSHFEGARTTNVFIYKGVVTMTNCSIYSSLGNTNMILGGSFCTFDNCFWDDFPTELNKIYCSVAFLEGARWNKFSGVALSKDGYFADEVNSDHNSFDLRTFKEDVYPIINPQFQTSEYNILGPFEDTALTPHFSKPYTVHVAGE